MEFVMFRSAIQDLEYVYVRKDSVQAIEPDPLSPTRSRLYLAGVSAPLVVEETPKELLTHLLG
ncbi:hypothetical protein WKW50_23570 [Ochrobactrum sp. GPK 3]|uniref:hypothetical protein n=1 Tax=Brucella sp. 22210 TaxID=3453892 RepID=UPI003138551B